MARMGVNQRTQQASAERLPAIFWLGETIRQRVQHGGMNAQPDMTADDFDVLR